MKAIERFENSNTLRYGVNENGCIHIPKWIGDLLKSKGSVPKISKFDFHFSSLEFQGVSIFRNKIWSNWAFFKPLVLFLKNRYLKWGCANKSNWNTSYGHLKGWKSNYENDLNHLIISHKGQINSHLGYWYVLGKNKNKMFSNYKQNDKVISIQIDWNQPSNFKTPRNPFKKYDFDVTLGGNFRIYCEHENVDSFQVLTIVNLVNPMVCLCIKLTPSALTTILFWFVHFDVYMSSTWGVWLNCIPKFLHNLVSQCK
jgi:hypothetical protein